VQKLIVAVSLALTMVGGGVGAGVIGTPSAHAAILHFQCWNPKNPTGDVIPLFGGSPQIMGLEQAPAITCAAV